MWWVVAHGCGGATTDRSSGDDRAPDTVTGETGAGSDDTALPPAPLRFTAPPSIRANPDAGLTAWLDAGLDAPAELTVEVAIADGPTWTQTSPAAETHELLLLGLRADRDVTLTVTARSGSGAVAGPERLDLHTDPLPDDLYPPIVVVHDRSRVEPGMTLVTGWRRITLLDTDGEPVWFVASGSVDEAHFDTSHHLWYSGTRDHVHEVDLAGRVLRRLAAQDADPQPGQTDVPLLAMHHEVQTLPDGHLLVLDIERRKRLFPTSETDPDAPESLEWVAGDVVTELTPEGDVVGRWPMLDRLDPDRIGFDSVRSQFWEDSGPWQGDTVRDWGHANALSYDPGTDSILVSLRHQDAMVSIDRAGGQVRWIIAPTANWDPPWSASVLVPPPGDPAVERRAYHQHSAKHVPGGTVILFDNGNHQASPFEPPSDQPVYSRVLEVRPRPELGTFETVWSWGESAADRFYAPSMGDADVLPTTDNVLVTIGNPLVGAPRIVEVARDGTVVWEATMQAPGQWYRSERIAGLFPWE